MHPEHDPFAHRYRSNHTSQEHRQYADAVKDDEVQLNCKEIDDLIQQGYTAEELSETMKTMQDTLHVHAHCPNCNTPAIIPLHADQIMDWMVAKGYIEELEDKDE